MNGDRKILSQKKEGRSGECQSVMSVKVLWFIQNTFKEFLRSYRYVHVGTGNIYM